MDKSSFKSYALISGFWLWIILIQDNPQGTDLLDACINYVNSAAGAK